MNMIMVGLLVSSVLAFGVFIYFLVSYFNPDRARSKKKVNKGLKSDFLYQSYHLFMRLPISRDYMRKIKKRVLILESADHITVARKTMKFTYTAVSISGVLFLLINVMGKSLYSFLISLMLVYIVHGQIIMIFIERMDSKLLAQLERFMGDVRHFYHSHGMIEEAIYDATENAEYEIGLYANQIYEVLTSENLEEEIEKFNESAPNKFFRTFLALAHTVMKFGDQKVDGRSMFLNNLNFLKQEINIELLKRKRLDHLLKSLSVIAVAPLLFVKPLEYWAVSNLPELKTYYCGGYGKIMPVLIFIVSLVCYQLIINMQSHVENKFHDAGLEVKLLRIKSVNKMMDMFVNKHYKHSMQILNLLKNTGNQLSVKEFYVKRMVYLLFTFVLTLILMGNLHYANQKNIINSIELGTATDPVALKQIEFERSLYKDSYMALRATKYDYFIVSDYIRRTYGIENEEKVSAYTRVLLDKKKLIDSEYFKWYDLLFACLMSWAVFRIPVYVMIFKKQILQMDMEDEVLQFHAIILMLMYIERITVENILEWMERFGFIFKSSISRCLDNFEQGDIEALEQLKLDEPYLPFVRLVENLQSASDKIPIRQAFDEILSDRTYYQEKRKVDNDIIISKKATLGRVFAFAPMGMTIVVQLLVPFTLESINQMMIYSTQIKDLI